MAGIPLRQMQVNQTGTIVSVKAKDELGRRIRDMGLVPGKEIRIQGRAPLNDPVSLWIMEAGKSHLPATHDWLVSEAQKLTHHLDATLDTHAEGMIADQRYGFIASILKQGVTSHTWDRNRLAWSDKIDKILTHRFLGPVIMVSVLMALYQFTFTYSAVPVEWFETFSGWLGDRAELLFPDGLLKSPKERLGIHTWERT